MIKCHFLPQQAVPRGSFETLLGIDDGYYKRLSIMEMVAQEDTAQHGRFVYPTLCVDTNNTYSTEIYLPHRLSQSSVRLYDEESLGSEVGVLNYHTDEALKNSRLVDHDGSNRLYVSEGLPKKIVLYVEPQNAITLHHMVNLAKKLLCIK